MPDPRNRAIPGAPAGFGRGGSAPVTPATTTPELGQSAGGIPVDNSRPPPALAAQNKGPGYQLARTANGWEWILVDAVAQKNWEAQRNAPQLQQPNIPGASTPAAPAPTLAGQYRGQSYQTPGAVMPGVQTAQGAPRQELRPGQVRDQIGQTPGQQVGGPVSVDYSRYDQAAERYQQASDVLMSELDRLSGVDPFGNQAFLRQATDRAAAQAGGVAAGGLSTATARAGNIRQAQGQQAAMVAQGRDAVERQRSADQVQAGALRQQAAGTLANVASSAAGNEVQLAQLQTQTLASNLDRALQKYQIDATLSQQDVESLRQMAVAYSQLDMERYRTDMNYRAQVDQEMVQRFGINQQTQVAMAQIAAGENLSAGEVAMGLIGGGAGLAGGIATAPATSVIGKALTSDRRAKIDVRDPDLRDLQDYLGGTKGKLYRYKEPNKPGRRAGLNYGPMAQDLARSRIGRTIVSKDDEGTLQVDTGRLALADHAALAAVAADLAELKKVIGK